MEAVHLKSSAAEESVVFLTFACLGEQADFSTLVLGVNILHNKRPNSNPKTRLNSLFLNE